MSLDMTLGVTPDTVDVLQPKTGVVNHPNAIQPQKFIVITGGTVSGVGKGTTISCIGVILKSMGFNVTAIKIDPYLNVDAGTMSPYEHGEVYVLEDGGEVDLDLGNYERFLDITLTRDHNITTGKVYEKVLRDERGGRYLGKTVQLIPHVTNTIQEWIRRVAQIPVSPQRPGRPDICLVEVGGTVGDIESLSYLEALQQFYMSIGDKNFCLCHVSYIPEIGSGISREQKTKPTQNSIKNVLSQKAKDKISLLGQAPLQNIIDVHNVPNIFFAPSMIDQQGFGLSVCEKFGLIPSQSYLESRNKVFSPLPNMINPLVGQDFCGYSVSKLEQLGNSMQSIERIINVGIVGKYTGSEDSYLSVIRAIQHAALVHNVHPKISWINSSDLEDPKNEEAWETLRNCHGIVCPGGFGDRGIPGKMASSRYCRMNNVPYLGICLGMQAAVIEFCRSELGLIHADSEEFNKDAPDKVVVFMPEIHSTTKGGTMRLGNRATIIRDPNSFAFRIYGAKPVIYERHRHRYEVNSLYVPVMESKGLMFVGQDEKGQRMEIAELQNHIFFLLTQYHPEFTSRIFRPNPCFLALIEACCTRIK